MSHPDFARTARHITPELMRDTLIDMVNISSPTGGERGMAEYIVGRLSRAGLDTQLQEVAEGRPNAIGVLRGDGGGLNLLFTGHMDTTWHGDETFLTSEGHKAKAHHRDGWVWGLGANNMKSGLASALAAIEAIAKEGVKLKGDLILGAVVGEIEKAAVEEFKGLWLDSYGAGTRYMVTHGVTADFAILGEPTGLRVCTANMGAIWAKIATAGTLSHSARARSGDVINAIEEMHDLHTEFAAMDRGLRSRPRIPRRASERHHIGYPRRHAVAGGGQSVRMPDISRHPRRSRNSGRGREAELAQTTEGLCRRPKSAGADAGFLCHQPADRAFERHLDQPRDAGGAQERDRRGAWIILPPYRLRRQPHERLWRAVHHLWAGRPQSSGFEKHGRGRRALQRRQPDNGGKGLSRYRTDDLPPGREPWLEASLPGLTPQVGYTRLAALNLVRNSGKPEFRCNQSPS